MFKSCMQIETFPRNAPSVSQKDRTLMLHYVTCRVNCLYRAHSDLLAPVLHAIGKTHNIPSEMKALFVAHCERFKERHKKKKWKKALFNPDTRRFSALDPAQQFAKVCDIYALDHPDDYFDHENETYANKKIVFEQSNFKVIDPHIYVEIQTPLIERSFTMLKRVYGDKHYSVFNRKKAAWERRKFITKWTEDKDIRTYRKMICAPGDPGSDDVYNAWVPAPYSAIYHRLNQHSLIVLHTQKLFTHIHDTIADSVAEHAEWLIDFFCFILQKPGKRTKVAILLISVEGSGKKVITDFLTSLLGQHNVFHKFSDSPKGKMLMIFHEVPNLDSMAGMMKNLVTSDTLHCNSKRGQGVITYKNTANIIMTCPFNIAPTDSRYAAFEYSGSAAYFSDLAVNLNDEMTKRAFVTYAMERDLSKYNDDFRLSRPITAFHKSLSK